MSGVIERSKEVVALEKIVLYVRNKTKRCLGISDGFQSFESLRFRSCAVLCVRPVVFHRARLL